MVQLISAFAWLDSSVTAAEMAQDGPPLFIVKRLGPVVVRDSHCLP